MADQIALTPRLTDYIRASSLREDEILRALREETADLPGGPVMQVTAEEGQFLALLARALPAGAGRVVSCDISDRWPEVGAEYWERAGLADRIDLRIGDARKTLEQLLADEGPGVFDLVFIDADKPGYPRYYELSLALVRPGGLIVVDNTLFFGRVVDPEAQDPDTVGVRELNEILRDDDRVDISMLAIADGVTLARRKS